MKKINFTHDNKRYISHREMYDAIRFPRKGPRKTNCLLYHTLEQLVWKLATYYIHNFAYLMLVKYEFMSFFISALPTASLVSSEERYAHDICCTRYYCAFSVCHNINCVYNWLWWLQSVTKHYVLPIYVKIANSLNSRSSYTSLKF